jgi:hypothetical protein
VALDDWHQPIKKEQAVNHHDRYLRNLPCALATASLLAAACTDLGTAATATSAATPTTAAASPRAAEQFPGATEPFAICGTGSGAFSANVTNAYFPLRVCSRITLAGLEDGVEKAVRITVLNETRMISGVPTRVVEEYHTEDGELVELSYNFFTQALGGGVPSTATSPRDGTACYYGELVDIYHPDGTITHEGQWITGEAGARPGIVMPARAKLGQAYLQEVASGVAEDRAWHTALGATLMAVTEDTPLDPGHFSHKVYRKGRGLVRDGETALVSSELLDRDDCVRAGQEDDDDDERD